jgi:hypothetical protein
LVELAIENAWSALPRNLRYVPVQRKGKKLKKFTPKDPSMFPQRFLANLLLCE